MHQIIFQINNGLNLASVADIAQADTLLSDAVQWVEVSGPLPDAPREAWLVDWETGIVSVDPNWEPPAQPPPSPAYSAAWLELINSAIYQRVMGVLPTHNSVGVFIGAYGQNVNAVFTHQHWAGALSASVSGLAAAVNATDAPLSADEMAWVEDWSIRHHLGLLIDWPQNP